jgi:hypothetical protein
MSGDGDLFDWPTLIGVLEAMWAEQNVRDCFDQPDTILCADRSYLRPPMEVLESLELIEAFIADGEPVKHYKLTLRGELFWSTFKNRAKENELLYEEVSVLHELSATLFSA